MDKINKRFKELIIEKNLKKILYIKNTDKKSIEWGMNYITFSPSKRFRPLLLLEANIAFSQPDNDSYILASAIELIHAYSLVHDDLPCMDNDDLRRGLPTLHKVKNEAYAVLVGDALLTKSFGLLSKYSKTSLLPEILKLFNIKAGNKGMICGQYLDMEGEGKKLDIDSINLINKNKTSALLELSLMCGAINGNASKNNINIMEKLGLIFGQIFQLKDDILDIKGNSKTLGKNTGSDQKNKKSSLPLILGLDESNKILDKYKKQAEKLINNIPKNKDNFFNILEFLITREK